MLFENVIATFENNYYSLYYSGTKLLASEWEYDSKIVHSQGRQLQMLRKGRTTGLPKTKRAISKRKGR